MTEEKWLQQVAKAAEKSVDLKEEIEQLKVKLHYLVNSEEKAKLFCEFWRRNLNYLVNLGTESEIFGGES